MNEDDHELEESLPKARRRLSLEEFLVDFLGGLVPGGLFMVAGALALGPPLHSLTMALGDKPGRGLLEVTTELLSSAQRTPSALWLIMFFVGTILAYVVGHLFYRHDLKDADRSSFRRLVGRRHHDDTWCRSNLACATVEECEFPYPYLNEYLKHRGHHHLLSLVTWQGESHLRSKTHINVLKIRLRYYHPDKCGTIIRNEAHVRLASSTWYVSKLLMWIGAVGIAINVGAIVASATHGHTYAAISKHAFSLAAPLIVIGLSVYSWWTIRGFLHYQRLREVFFVLETAFTAFATDPSKLDPPFKLVPKPTVHPEGVSL